MTPSERFEFLPVSKEDMEERGWYYYDFLLVTGDAYVDHPSFGCAVIARVLEAEGYRVAVLAQPDYRSKEAFLKMGRPRYGAMITAGNIDSMVAHYTAAKKRRSADEYTAGGKSGKRPDRASIVYANRVREAFSGLPVILGGLEASLRRFSHYDYWDDAVRRPLLFDSKADLLIYGMGEHPVKEIASRLKKGEAVSDIRDVRGSCFLADEPSACPYPSYVLCDAFETVSEDKRAYAESAMLQYEEQDFKTGKAVVQKCGDKYLIQNPPARPLSGADLDRVYALPFTRSYHPSYEGEGGVPALSEVEFSIIHNRGCFGACNFCSLAFHQGRYVTSRSHESVLREAEAFGDNPRFKGYIHDVGGPTANFRHPACKKQEKAGVCKNRQCLFPEPCGNLDASHSDYLALLRELKGLPHVKKVFIRSGIRYDYLLCDKDGEFFSELVRDHVSGQLKVAPEHKSERVLYYMGKPSFEVYERFLTRYGKLNQRYGKEQYVVPYLMSSHPGSTLEDAIELALYLKRGGHMPEQVQDFYPTPGTLSTAMYHTGLDPRTMKPVYVPKTPLEKAMQRALLQWGKKENRALVIRALHEAGREDLIGFSKDCLIRPQSPKPRGARFNKEVKRKTGRRKG